MNNFIYYNGKIYKFGIVPIKGKDFNYAGEYTPNYHYEKQDFIMHDFSLYCAKEDFTATTFEDDLQNNLLELAVRNTLQTITFSTAFTNDPNEEDINANLVRDGGSVIEPNYKLNFINFDLLSRKANTARYIDLEMDNNTYRITAKLKNDKGEVIATSNVIDLPSESTVVNAKVSDDGNNLILTLRSGQEVSVSLGSMLSNLQQKITSNNKLPSDLVSDVNQANKFVTEQEKTNIANNTNARHTHSNKTTLDKITENHLTRINKAVQDEDFEKAMQEVYEAKQDVINNTINCEIRTEEIKDENDNVVDERTVLEVGSYNKNTNPNGFVRMSDILNEINKLKQELIPAIGMTIESSYSSYDPNEVYQDTTWELQPTTKAYIVETYRNGFSYYRIYSDGFIEQGGRVSVAENASQTVTLHKEMKDTNYNVLITNNCKHTTKNAEGVLTATILSKTQIQIHAGYIDPNTSNCFWVVRGFSGTPNIHKEVYKWIRTA